MRNPYYVHFITGQDRGYRYSSFTTPVGELFAGQALGQAKIEAFVNIGTGQAYVETFKTTISERGHELELGLCFNNGFKDQWRITLDKRFKTALPDHRQCRDGQKIILIEQDGHETTYTYDAKRYKFQPPSHGSGFTPSLAFDTNLNLWLLKFPKDQRVEYYDHRGLRLRSEDAMGRPFCFEYDDKTHALKKMYGLSGISYEIEQSEVRICIYRVEAGGRLRHLLQQHEFAKEPLSAGYQLQESDIGGYKIYYAYRALTTKTGTFVYLTDVVQSDGSHLSLYYAQNKPTDIPRIQTAGSSEYTYGEITYNDEKNSVGFRSFNESRDHFEFTLDTNKRLVKKDFSRLDIRDHHQFTTDSTLYHWEDDGCGLTITYPDQTSAQWLYDVNPLQRLIKQIKRDGSSTEWVYEAPNYELAALMCVIENSQTVTAKTVQRFVYERVRRQDEYGKKANLIAWLPRFILTSEGRVLEHVYATEKAYVEIGDCLGRRYYPNPYPVKKLPKDVSPAIDYVLQWRDQQDLSQTTFERYTPDQFGHAFEIWRYRALDPKGQGVDKADDTDYEQCVYQPFGVISTHEQRFLPGRSDLVTEHHYQQELQRLDSYKDVDGQLTTDHLQFATFKYRLWIDKPALRKITYPNHRLETHRLDDLGEPDQVDVTAKTIAGEQVSQIESFRKIDDGSLREHRLADRSFVGEYTDGLGRVIYQVFPDGSVTQSEYQDSKRLVITRHFAKAIDLEKDDKGEFKLPGCETLINLLSKQVDDADNRLSFELQTPNGKPEYQVDSAGYLIQTIYDDLNRYVLAKIRYKTPLTTEQLDKIRQGDAPEIEFNPEIDRQTQDFYDLDGNLLYHQDEAGYVTAFIRDVNGYLLHQIQYATPTKFTRDLKQLIPAEKPGEDAHHYYFRNNQNEVIAEVDPDNYLITHSYYSFGKVKRSIAWAEQLPSDWLSGSQGKAPTPPAINGEDRILDYAYDKQFRQTQCTQKAYALDAEGKPQADKLVDLHALIHRYDQATGQLLETSEQDLLAPDNKDGDHYRSQQIRIDGFVRKAQEANAMVCAKLAEPDVDPESIWQDKARQIVYSSANKVIKVTDSNGFSAYFIRDLKHRVRFKIVERKLKSASEKVGVITEFSYNVFDDKTAVRQYQATLPLADIPVCPEGLLTDAVLQTLQALANDANDSVIRFQPDKRGLPELKIDAEGNKTRYQHNAFHEVEDEWHPVADKEPTLHIHRTFDPRGDDRVLEKTQTAGDLVKTVKQEFANLHGKLSSTTNAHGAKDELTYSARGDHRKRRLVDLDTEETWETDAFARDRSHTDVLQQQTRVVHCQQQRQRHITPPIKNTAYAETQNSFAEVVEHEDALGAKQIITHQPSSDMHTHSDVLEAETRIERDLETYVSETLHPNHRLDQREHDGGDAELTLTEDAGVGGVNAATTRERDGLALPRVLLSAEQRQTKQSFDRNLALKQQINDPEQAAVTVAFVRNAQSAPIQQTHSAVDDDQQYTIATERDPFGQEQAMVKDPDDLKVRKQTIHDTTNRLKCVIDGKGNKQWILYDARDNKRFVVSANGGVVEWQYNAKKLKTLYREYSDPIALTEGELTLEAVEQAVTGRALGQDKLRRYFYDDNDNESLVLNGLGQVCEKAYNRANHPITTCTYSEALPNTLDLLTVDQKALADFVDAHRGDKTNRVRHAIVDAKGRERFIIEQYKDHEGKQVARVTEQRFDAHDNVITKIAYATLIDEDTLHHLLSLGIDDVYGALPKDNANDRLTHQKFNRFDKLLWSIKPGDPAEVTGYSYDKDKLLTSVCQYAARDGFPAFDSSPEAYQTYLNAVTAFQYDADKDRKESYTYDGVGRKFSREDARGNKESFYYNALNKERKNTDREDHDTDNLYDKAGRLRDVILPPIDVTLVEYVPGDTPDSGHLAAKVLKAERLTQHHGYDEAENPTSITFAYGLDAIKGDTVTSEFDADRHLTASKIADVPIDDPEALASFDQRPDAKTQFTVKQFIYNTRHIKVGEVDAARRYQYWIHNNEDKIQYRVLPDKTLIEYVYNNFNESVKVIRYRTKLDIDLVQYAEYGIPHDVIESKKVAHPLDRSKILTRAGNGLIYVVEDGAETLYSDGQTRSVPIKDAEYQMQLPVLKYTKKTREFSYDRFKEATAKATLITKDNKTGESRWAKTLIWPDRNGKPLVEVDAAGYVTRKRYNAFKQLIEKVEYQHKFTVSELESLTLIELDKLLAEHADKDNDRHYSYEYDQNGNLKKEILHDLEHYALVKDPSGRPHIEHQGMADRVIQYFYDKNDRLIAKEFPNGARCYYFYNARGDRIAETGIPFASKNQAGEAITIVPFTEYGYDYRSKQVTKRRYHWGAKAPVDHAKLTYPEPRVAGDSTDPCSISLLDQRGKVLAHQNDNGALKGFSYHLSGHEARKWLNVTDFKDKETKQQRIDEFQTFYDDLDHIVHKSLNQVKDGSRTVVDQFYAGFNAFGESLGDSDTQDILKHIQVRLSDGTLYYDNDKDENKLTLCDLSGRPIVILQSPTKDLSQVTPDKLEAFLATIDDPDDLWVTVTLRDERGDIYTHRLPEYLGRPELNSTAVENSDDKDAPLIPLAISLQDTYPETDDPAISWPLPQITTAEAKEIKLTPLVTGGTPVAPLAILEKDGKAWVNIKDVPAGDYEMEIVYYLRDPSHSQHLSQARRDNKTPLYQSTGPITIISHNSVESVAPIAYMQHDHQLVVSGNTDDLSTIDLYADPSDDKPVATVTVTPAKDNAVADRQDYTADLSTIASGRYYARPSQSTNPEWFSQPLYVYTSIPAAKPFAQPILFNNFCIQTLYDQDKDKTYLAIDWQVPERFSDKSIELVFKYTDIDGKPQSQTWVLAPNAPRTSHTDAKGNVLQSNAELDGDIKDFTSSSVKLYIDDANHVPLCTDLKPLLTDDDDELIHAHHFMPTNTLYLSGVKPDPHSDAPFGLDYFSTHHDNTAEWVKLLTTGLMENGAAFDISELPFGNFPYRYGDKTKNVDGQRFVNGDFVILSDMDGNNGKQVLFQPVHHFEHDAKQNVVKHVDPYGRDDQKTFGKDDRQTSSITPEVTVTNEYGESSFTRLTTKFPRDLTGYALGEIRNSGAQSVNDVNAAGLTVANYEGNEPKAMRSADRDGLLMPFASYDSRSKKTVKTFSGDGKHILKTQFASGTSIANTFNEQSVLIESLDQAGFATRYGTDIWTAHIRRIIPGGQIWNEIRNRHGLITYFQDPCLNESHYGYGYFGRKEWYQNLAGSRFEYQYHISRDLKSIEQVSGKPTGVRLYLQPHFMTMDQIEYLSNYSSDSSAYIDHRYQALVYTAQTQSVMTQQRFDIRPGGGVTRIYDLRQGMLQDRQLDQLGLIIDEQTYQTLENADSLKNIAHWLLLSHKRMAYNALHELSHGFDTMALVDILRDEDGNHRATLMDVFTATGSDPMHSESWYHADPARRVTHANCILNQSTKAIEPNSKQGIVMTYDGEYRKSEANGKQETVALDYDDDGRLNWTEQTKPKGSNRTVITTSMQFTLTGLTHQVDKVEAEYHGDTKASETTTTSTTNYDAAGNGWFEEYETFQYSGERPTIPHRPPNNIAKYNYIAESPSRDSRVIKPYLPTGLAQSRYAIYAVDGHNDWHVEDKSCSETYDRNGLSDDLRLQTVSAERVNPWGEGGGRSTAQQYFDGNGDLSARTDVDYGDGQKQGNSYFSMMLGDMVVLRSVETGYKVNNYSREWNGATLYFDRDTHMVRPFTFNGQTVASYRSDQNQAVLTNYISSAVSENALHGGGNYVVTSADVASPQPPSSFAADLDDWADVTAEIARTTQQVESFSLVWQLRGDKHLPQFSSHATTALTGAPQSNLPSTHDVEQFRLALDHLLSGKTATTKIDWLSRGAKEARSAAAFITEFPEDAMRYNEALASMLQAESGAEVWDNLAEKLYNNKDLGQKLAEANGRDYHTAPTVGVLLKVPQMLANSYRANTNEAYQTFVSETLKSLYPHLNMHQHEEKHHHHWWQEIIEIVVSIVICIVAPEIAPVIMGSQALGVAVVAGAMELGANLAEQGLANLTGDQHGFDVREALYKSVATGVTAGIGYQAFGLASIPMKMALKMAAETAVANQLVGMAFGVSHFNVKMIFAQMAATVASNEAAEFVAPETDNVVGAMSGALVADITVAGVMGTDLQPLQVAGDMAQAGVVTYAEDGRRKRAAQEQELMQSSKSSTHHFADGLSDVGMQHELAGSINDMQVTSALTHDAAQQRVASNELQRTGGINADGRHYNHVASVRNAEGSWAADFSAAFDEALARPQTTAAMQSHGFFGKRARGARQTVQTDALPDMYRRKNAAVMEAKQLRLYQAGEAVQVELNSTSHAQAATHGSYVAHEPEEHERGLETFLQGADLIHHSSESVYSAYNRQKILNKLSRAGSLFNDKKIWVAKHQDLHEVRDAFKTKTSYSFRTADSALHSTFHKILEIVEKPMALLDIGTAVNDARIENAAHGTNVQMREMDAAMVGKATKIGGGIEAAEAGAWTLGRVGLVFGPEGGVAGGLVGGVGGFAFYEFSKLSKQVEAQTESGIRKLWDYSNKR